MAKVELFILNRFKNGSFPFRIAEVLLTKALLLWDIKSHFYIWLNSIQNSERWEYFQQLALCMEI